MEEAKSIFTEGLVMDFSPDNTQANCLTSALNATLLTFNGNEMSLLGDMGNGRVETARLPEGYIPVGTCEFGDIIYIVSYNPIINKSLIGCFPSPERNISSDELGNAGLSITWTEFLENDDYDQPNGELKALSIKKVLLLSKDMSPGDKYIIYSSDLVEETQELEKNNILYLTDYNNTDHDYGKFPKLFKIHIVSIEDTGKVIYLDSDIKWYDNDYFICNTEDNLNNKPDIDSYRTMVSSAYSIFSSKYPGKLALLIELEKINSFNCTWSAYKTYYLASGYNVYQIYWNIGWGTDNFNINPKYIFLTKSEWDPSFGDNAGKYFKYEYNSKTNLLELDSGTKLEDLPIAYNSGDLSTLDTCYKQEITRVYKPELYKGTYSEFKDTYSYARLLKSWTKLILNDRGEYPEKITLGRQTTELGNLDYYIGLPTIGSYFINNDYKNLDNTDVKSYTISDDIVNNSFNYPVTKAFQIFKIPSTYTIDEIGEERNVDIGNLVYNYEITPAMPYGLLREYSQKGSIDFSKIGKGHIDINTWRYYNYQNTSTLNWGMEAYTEPNKGIKEVEFLFYDNLGLAAVYRNSNKASYNGSFMEYITLNSYSDNLNSNYKGEEFYHKNSLTVDRESLKDDTKYIYVTAKEEFLTGKDIKDREQADDEKIYLNDAGILWSNRVYLVKIVIKYNSISFGEYVDNELEWITKYRWYWTNTLFNSYFSGVDVKAPLDFKDLEFVLDLNCISIFDTIKDKYKIESIEYRRDSEEEINSSDQYKSLSATVLYINLVSEGDTPVDNVKMAIRAGLLDDYNTFNLNEEGLSDIYVNIYAANDYLYNVEELPEVLFSSENGTIFPGIYPVNAKECTGLLDPDNQSSNFFKKVGVTHLNPSGSGGSFDTKHIYSDTDNYINYPNNFLISLSHTYKNEGDWSKKSLSYLDSNGELTTLENCNYYSTTLDKVYFSETTKSILNDKQILLSLSGIHYSKYHYTTKYDERKMLTLRAFVSEEADLYKYWLYKNSEGNIQYQKAIGTALSLSDDGYHSMCICTFEDNKIVNIDDMFVGTEDRNIHDQRNTSFRELYDLDDAGANHYPRNLYNLYVPFMVPMILGSNIYKGSFNTPEVKVYSSPLKIQYLKVGKFFGTLMIDGEVKNLLGGTLAYTYNIDTKKVIYPSIYYNTDFEHYLLTRNVKDVLACLTLLFYLDSTESSVTRWVPDNYASLKDNYMVYKKDIVVELKPDYKSKKVKEFINLCGIKYQSYINEVIKKSKAVSIDIAMENVNLILKGCLITTPIEFHIDYKLPNIDASYITDNVKVESIFHDFNTTNLNIVPNTIYAYNNSTKQFENVKGVGNLISVPIDIDIENKIYLKDLEYKTDITKFNTLLMKDDENRLGIESNILSKGSYTIHTCNLLNYSVYYGFEGTPKVDIFNCINNVY